MVDLLSAFQWVSIGVGALVVLVAALVISASVRLWIMRRGDE